MPPTSASSFDSGGVSSTLVASEEPSPTDTTYPPVTTLTHSSSSATVRPSSKKSSSSHRSPEGLPPPDPSRLAPQSAIFPPASTRRAFTRSQFADADADAEEQLAVRSTGNSGVAAVGGSVAVNGNGSESLSSVGAAGRIMEQRRKRERERGRSGSRRRKGAWKKLLWVKQTYPDNYTDEETFLDHLQRNPRLQPYEFWPLVTDSTVIVQHVMSVAIWISCFSGITQNRVTPFMVVSAGSAGTVLGWLLWDYWVSKEEEMEMAATAAALAMAAAEAARNDGGLAEDGTSSTSSASSAAAAGQSSTGLGLLLPNANAPGARQGHSRGGSLASVVSNGSAVSAISTGHPTGDSTFATASQPPHGEPMSPRNQRRWATIKSAVLIYCVLLGLSPILKSLTKSTTSDSIWAMTSFLTIINISFFDYGGGVGAKFPASLSTNAAIMAATVLASRLESTTDVFSFMLFSIEVFGLFPVFRRHLRHVSWRGHLLLAIFLVMSAGAGLSMAVSGGGLRAAITGAILGSFLTGLVMGICSWWLIGLQKYKNEIHGPWDPARPVIRRSWD